MEEKKPFGSRLEAFFAGRGFYIVLFLCVAVIGVSAWSLLTGDGLTSEEAPAEIAVDKLDSSSYEAPAVPAAAPVVTEAPAAAERQASSERQEPAEKVLAPAQSPEPEAAETAATPAAVPVSAPADDYFIRPVSGAVDVGYCMDVPVFNPTMQDWRTHDGLDLTAELGAQVRACANGTVTAVYEDDLFGTTVVIGHGGGLESVYANLSAAPNVAVGDWVSAGQVIGAVGSSAIGEAGQVCHLHFAMRQGGESVDPTAYLP